MNNLFSLDSKQHIERHARRRLLGLFSVLLFLNAFAPAALAGAQLVRFQVVQQSNLMLHLDFDRPIENVNVFALSNPHRLVIDLAYAELNTTLALDASRGMMLDIRHGFHGDQKLRIAVDLSMAAKPSHEVITRQGGQRLIIDTGIVLEATQAPSQATPVEQVAILAGGFRDVIVAIDAGHGGKDGGATGQRNTLEKDITLAVAKRLHERLNAQEGISAILTRNKDEYIALRERIRIARDQHADIFVSVHADAFKRKAAAGSSVYALSLKGASSEAAQWLAENENNVDALFGEVQLDGLSVDLKQTLLDLAQSSTLEASLDMGAEVLDQLKQVGPVHKPDVEQANFAVLRSPDIPSVLVEIAFISNLLEEKKLNDARFQDALAIAIQNGIVRFLNRRAPLGTRLAAARQKSSG
ncbi:MAG: N-acetylmuramoyl-L-alanine amidase [Granulosicoccaceae bacterium]